MHRLRIVLVGTLAVVAGCSGLGPAPESGSPAGTVTPMSVPEDRSGPAGSGSNTSLPPGVHANGSVDSAALFAAHDRALSNRSYRLAVSMSGGRESTDRNGTVIAQRRWNTSFTVSVEGERELLSLPEDERDSPIRQSYRDATGVYVYDPWEGMASFRANAVSPADQFDLEPTTVLLNESAPTLKPEAVEITPVERAGDTLFRVAVPSDPRSATRSNYESYTAVLFVTETGLVRSLYLEYESALGRTHNDREIRYTFHGLGATTITEPGWVVNANASRTDRSRSVADAGVDATAARTPDNNGRKTLGGDGR